MEDRLVHLHNHTHYSLLDGLQKLDKMLDRAVEYGMKAVAITDHGAMCGAIDFYLACKKRNLKPIIGEENFAIMMNMIKNRKIEIPIIAIGGIRLFDIDKLSI
jgi:DNA polymerase-3 subunit alpha